MTYGIQPDHQKSKNALFEEKSVPTGGYSNSLSHLFDGQWLDLSVCESDIEMDKNSIGTCTDFGCRNRIESSNRCLQPRKDIILLKAIWILSKKDANPSITKKLIDGSPWKVIQNHHRILMYHSTKNGVNWTNSLGGVWLHTDTHRGVTTFIR